MQTGWTTPPGNRPECPTSPANYTESANRLQRTSKTRIGQTVRYFIDSKGRFTDWVDFSSGDHNEEEWPSQTVHWPKTLKWSPTQKSLPFTHNRWCTASPIKGPCVHITWCEKWVLARSVGYYWYYTWRVTRAKSYSRQHGWRSPWRSWPKPWEVFNRCRQKGIKLNSE